MNVIKCFKFSGSLSEKKYQSKNKQGNKQKKPEIFYGIEYRFPGIIKKYTILNFKIYFIATHKHSIYA